MTDTEILDLLDRYEAVAHRERVHPSDDFGHLLTMIPKMRNILADITVLREDELVNQRPILTLREKVMRWLGFMQGVLWVKGIYTIDEMREHNRPQ